jgi:hypothetical protein
LPWSSIVLCQLENARKRPPVSYENSKRLLPGVQLFSPNFPNLKFSFSLLQITSLRLRAAHSRVEIISRLIPAAVIPRYIQSYEKGIGETSFCWHHFPTNHATPFQDARRRRRHDCGVQIGRRRQTFGYPSLARIGPRVWAKNGRGVHALSSNLEPIRRTAGVCGLCGHLNLAPVLITFFQTFQQKRTPITTRI